MLLQQHNVNKLEQWNALEGIFLALEISSNN